MVGGRARPSSLATRGVTWMNEAKSLALPAAADLPLLLQPASATADDLAERINAAITRAQEAGREAVARAVEAGALLLEAKKKVGHGGWGEWLERNRQMAERTAQAYMRLARELPKLEPAKAQRVADSSLRDAL